MNIFSVPTNIIVGNRFLGARFNSQHSDQPDFVHPDYVKHYDKFALTTRFELGLDYLQEYLAKYPNEDQSTYSARQKLLTLKNYVTRLSTGITGMISRKPSQITEESARLKEVLEALDGQRPYEEVIKEAIYKTSRDGICWIRTDAPREGEDGKPYITILDRYQVINWRFDDLRNLVMCVVYESLSQENGLFGLQEVEVYTAYRMVNGLCEITRYTRNNAEQTTNAFNQEETVRTDFDFMPVEQCYLSEVPIMADVAKINIRHMNFVSSLDRYLTMAALPIPLVWGADVDDDGNPNPGKPAMILGVDQAMFFSGPKTEADFEWRELSGTSVELLKNHIATLEQDMLEAFERSAEDATGKGIGNEAATTSVIKNKSSSAVLSNIAEIVQEAMQTSLDNLSKILGDKPGAILAVNKDFQPVIDGASIPTLLNAWTQGAISWETFIQGMQASEIVTIDDLEEERKLIDAEELIKQENMEDESESTFE